MDQQWKVVVFLGTARLTLRADSRERINEIVTDAAQEGTAADPSFDTATIYNPAGFMVEVLLYADLKQS